MRALLLLAVLLVCATAALVSGEASAEVKGKFALLQRVHSKVVVLTSIDQKAARIQWILARHVISPIAQKDFFQLNNDFRLLTSLVLDSGVVESLGNLDYWIFYYRPASLVLNDVRIQMRRATDYMNPIVKEVTAINEERAKALTLPMDAKVAAVNGTVVKFRSSLKPLSFVLEQLDEAIYDFSTFVSSL